VDKKPPAFPSMKQTDGQQSQSETITTFYNHPRPYADAHQQRGSFASSHGPMDFPPRPVDFFFPAFARRILRRSAPSAFSSSGTLFQDALKGLRE